MTKKSRKGVADPLAQAIVTFQIDDAVLPAEIDEAAFASCDYPHRNTLKKKPYERDLLALQIELSNVQVRVEGQRAHVVIVFEGRDAADKGLPGRRREK